jgi:hypothetical protein
MLFDWRDTNRVYLSEPYRAAIENGFVYFPGTIWPLPIVDNNGTVKGYYTIHPVISILIKIRGDNVISRVKISV